MLVCGADTLLCCPLCAADDSVSFTKEDMLEGLAQQGYAVPGKSQEEDEDGSSMAGSSAAHSSQPRPIPAQAGAAGSGAAASPLLMVSHLPCQKLACTLVPCWVACVASQLGISPVCVCADGLPAR